MGGGSNDAVIEHFVSVFAFHSPLLFLLRFYEMREENRNLRNCYRFFFTAFFRLWSVLTFITSLFFRKKNFFHLPITLLKFFLFLFPFS